MKSSRVFRVPVAPRVVQSSRVSGVGRVRGLRGKHIFVFYNIRKDNDTLFLYCSSNDLWLF